MGAEAHFHAFIYILLQKVNSPCHLGVRKREKEKYNWSWKWVSQGTIKPPRELWTLKLDMIGGFIANLTDGNSEPVRSNLKSLTFCPWPEAH